MPYRTRSCSRERRGWRRFLSATPDRAHAPTEWLCTEEREQQRQEATASSSSSAAAAVVAGSASTVIGGYCHRRRPATERCASRRIAQRDREVLVAFFDRVIGNGNRYFFRPRLPKLPSQGAGRRRKVRARSSRPATRGIVDRHFAVRAVGPRNLDGHRAVAFVDRQRREAHRKLNRR